DPLALRGEELLWSGVPYPGDDPLSKYTGDPSEVANERFCLYRVSDSEYVIMDHARRYEDPLISDTMLLDSGFDIVSWY
ncbi:hypothetical protein NEOLEDRAFT_1047838, partial [Neolentinus lepideus HHB14362 ss-1]